MQDKKHQILIHSFPKAKGKNRQEICITLDLFNKVTSKIEDIKWFNVIDQKNNIIGSVYLFLKNDHNSELVAVFNKLNPKELNNPRVSIETAFNKFLKHEYLTLDIKESFKGNSERINQKAMALSQILYNGKINNQKFCKDFSGCFNKLYKQ